MRYLFAIAGLLLVLGSSAFAQNPKPGKYSVVFTDKISLQGGESEDLLGKRTVRGSARVDADGYIYIVLPSGELPVAGDKSGIRATKIDSNLNATFFASDDDTVYTVKPVQLVSEGFTGFSFNKKTATFVDLGAAPDQLLTRTITWKFRRL
jgi:protein involved in polysaccharide export with SLBB domain